VPKPKPPPATAQKPSRKAALADWLARHQPSQISELDAVQIHHSLAPISASYLHKLLRQCGVPLAPMIDGVRQGSLNDLEDSLLALMGEYAACDLHRRQQVRALVITAKDHARFALSRATDESLRALKQETLLWLTTWLENPLVFANWVALRREQRRVISFNQNGDSGD
jgi:hypothetical protein